MIALDTNILARFFVDDPDDLEAAPQRPLAVAVMNERAFVSVTVLLEFEWVMRGFYQMPCENIVGVLRALMGFEHFVIEDRSLCLDAIDAFAGGMDFADAMHLARSSRAAVFRTFDKQFARKANRLSSGVRVEVLS